jgi:hypothetical protein
VPPQQPQQGLHAKPQQPRWQKPGRTISGQNAAECRWKVAERPERERLPVPRPVQGRPQGGQKVKRRCRSGNSIFFSRFRIPGYRKTENKSDVEDVKKKILIYPVFFFKIESLICLSL